MDVSAGSRGGCVVDSQTRDRQTGGPQCWVFHLLGSLMQPPCLEQKAQQVCSHRRRTAPCSLALAVFSGACVVDVEQSVGWKENAFTCTMVFKDDQFGSSVSFMDLFQ